MATGTVPCQTAARLDGTALAAATLTLHGDMAIYVLLMYGRLRWEGKKPAAAQLEQWFRDI